MFTPLIPLPLATSMESLLLSVEQNVLTAKMGAP